MMIKKPNIKKTFSSQLSIARFTAHFFLTSFNICKSLYGNGDAKRFYIDIRFLEQCHIVVVKNARNTVSVSKRGGGGDNAGSSDSGRLRVR